MAARDLLHLAFPEASRREDPWVMRAHVPFRFFFGRNAPAATGSL